MSKVERRRHGKGYSYRYSNGAKVTNTRLKRWLQGLVIPPAWEQVQIDTDRHAKVIATGRDREGRKQYIYNDQWRLGASRKKYERILRFGENLTRMRRITGQHIRRRPIDETAVLAAMTRMLDEAFFRPGSRAYTRAHHTHGLTTLRQKHMRLEPDRVVFDYQGKSHQAQHRVIKDPQVQALLTELHEMRGYEIFDITLADGNRKKITASDLNAYIAEVLGEHFSAKDFRTWAGTVLMALALDELGPGDTVKGCKSNIVQAVKKVAGALGNTPAICRENYIHPQVILHYETGRTLTYFRRQIKRNKTQHMSLDERATLKLLNHLIEERLAS